MSGLANAFGNYLLDKGYDVLNPISQFKFVKFSGTDSDSGPQVTAIVANTDVPCGVAQFHVTDTELSKGKGASVRTDGISECYVASTSGSGHAGQTAYLYADGSCGDNTVAGGTIVGIFRSDFNAGGRAAVEVSSTLSRYQHP